jgi:hypothetical protein
MRSKSYVTLDHVVLRDVVVAIIMPGLESSSWRTDNNLMSASFTKLNGSTVITNQLFD